MNNDYNKIVDKLLDMQPDPIPKFVLLKEFKVMSPNSTEYQNAFERVCGHSFVKEIAESQNNKGFWPSFHGYTEGLIRKLLWFGLDDRYNCLKRVKEYTVKLMRNEEPHDRFEKQDNVRWWPEMFMPLVCAATLSLLDNTNDQLELHRTRWAAFAENAFSMGIYDRDVDGKTQNDYFRFRTKCIIPPFNYYNLLLLSPFNGENCLSDSTDQALVDHCMNEVEYIGYVYNNNPGELVYLGAQNRDSRDFCHWIRALSLIAQFKGWERYEHKYVDWIMGQRNLDGLWEFPKKHDLFALSDLWKGRNRAIDSTIFVLRLLMKKRAF